MWSPAEVRFVIFMSRELVGFNHADPNGEQLHALQQCLLKTDERGVPSGRVALDRYIGRFLRRSGSAVRNGKLLCQRCMSGLIICRFHSSVLDIRSLTPRYIEPIPKLLSHCSLKLWHPFRRMWRESKPGACVGAHCQAPGSARQPQFLFLTAARLVSSRGLDELFANYPRSNVGVRECCPDALLHVYRQTPSRPMPHRAIHVLSLETHSRRVDDSVRQDAGLRCVDRDRLALFPTLSQCHVSSAEAHFVLLHDGADYSLELLQHCSNGHRWTPL